MKILFIILFIGCSCTTITWEEDFIKKGQHAQANKEYYDSNFYFKELAFKGNLHQQLAKDELLSFTYPQEPSTCNLLVDEEDRSNEIYLKAKSSFIALYNYEGSLDTHIALLKTLSKTLDPQKKGINLILRVSPDNPDLTYHFSEDDFLFEEEENPFIDKKKYYDYKAPKRDAKIFRYSFQNKSIYDILETICTELNLKFKITEHAIILAEHSVCLCAGHEVRFYNNENYYILNNPELFEEYAKEIVLNNAGSELSVVSFVNRIVIKDIPQNLLLFKNHVLPNFVETVELNYYQIIKHNSIKLTRANIEKHPDIFELDKVRPLDVMYQKSRTYEGLKFDYNVENQTQKITVTWEEQQYEFNYLGACDQVLKLDNETILLIKIR
jgi:hypothetical protein